jgi:hypothetical protein
MKNIFVAPIILLVFFPFFTFGQIQDLEQDIYTRFDEIVGIDNTGINNGIEYKEKYRVANKSYPYFNSPYFLIGSIEYDGDLYFNLNMKYNLYEQEIILQVKSRNSSEVRIKLFKDKIKSFTIGNHQFVKISSIDSNAFNIFGFYEVTYNDQGFSLLIKHKKSKKDLYLNSLKYSEYVYAKKEYIILFEGNYKEIKSKKDIIYLFPNLKEIINDWYNNKKSLRRTNYIQFLTELLQELKLATLKLYLKNED